MPCRKQFNPIARTQKEAGQVLGRSQRSIQDWISEGCPGRRGAYCIREMLAWAVAAGKYAQDVESEEGMLFSGAASPALEEFRSWKARLAELDYRERSGKLLSEDALRPFLDRVAAQYRELGERLVRDFGDAAADSLEDTASEVDRLIEQFFAAEEPDDSSGT